MAERLGLDQRTVDWLEVCGYLHRLALTEAEIRARLYQGARRHSERALELRPVLVNRQRE